jgi:hypothetical protein
VGLPSHHGRGGGQPLHGIYPHSPPRLRAGRITHFVQHLFDQPSDVALPVAIGEGHTPFPEHFRTKAQMDMDTAAN